MKISIKKRDLIYLYLVLILAIAAPTLGALVRQSFFVQVSISGQAPFITIVNATSGGVTPTVGGTVDLAVTFNATDSDGTANLDTSSIVVNVSINKVFRYNTSGNCNSYDLNSSIRVYTCEVEFFYFDNSSSDWGINVSIKDNNKNNATNDSSNNGANATIGSVSGFSLVDDTTFDTFLSYDSVTLGQTNVEDSIQLNNTGNFKFTEINITAYNLVGNNTVDFIHMNESDTASRSGTNSNFTANLTASTGVGIGRVLLNNTNVSLTTNAELFNFTQSSLSNIGAAVSHSTARIYVYLDVPNGITVQPYNTTRQWVVSAR